MALLDLSTAFDMVDFDILFRRLEADCGIMDSALQWIKSYLTDRKQAVRCGDALSVTTSLTCGVPQGFVLRPLLSLVYTTGLENIIRHHNLTRKAYADD